MINALRYTEELEKAGFTKEQAKKSVDTWMSLINENFVTKSDLKEISLKFDNRMDKLSSELTLLESRMTVKLGSFMVLGLSLMGAIIGLMSFIK